MHPEGGRITSERNLDSFRKKIKLHTEGNRAFFRM